MHILIRLSITWVYMKKFRISPEMKNEASLIEHSKYYNDVEF